MKRDKSPIGENGIYDAKQLGTPKMLILGLQHMFAMFGATVLVPLLTGLDVSTTLLMAGLGTLLFHLITKGKVPAFLGSSFAFLGGYAAVAPLIDGKPNTEMLPYACIGVAVAGLIYLILAGLFKGFGAARVMRFFPPVVTGPIIIAIGLILAPTAINSAANNWFLAIIAFAVIVIFNIWGKGMMKIIPIILGIIIAYAVGTILYFIAQGNPSLVESFPALFGNTMDFSGLSTVIKNIGNGDLWGNLIGLPVTKEGIAFLNIPNGSQVFSSIITIAPIALATMMEHIGDISAISATTGINFMKDPGLHRTLTGDGLATSFSSLFGGPANTTYGENTGVLALTKVYDPKVIRIAAFFAVGLSFFPIVSAIINTIPWAILGGVSFILYGMISAVGVRNVVESKVDFTKSRNLIIAATILVSALGFNATEAGGIQFSVGSVEISISALAIAALLGIILNAVLPGKDYSFDKDVPEETKTGVDFKV